MVRKDQEFRKTEFERRNLKKMGDLDVWVVTPEDLLLSKLEWWKESDSALQKSDLLLLLNSISDLDLDYIDHWAKELGVSESLEKLKS